MRRLVEIRHLSKTYRTKNKVTPILEDISLDVHFNDFVAILGASGSGKTSLLNIIGTLAEYDCGSYRFNGREVKALRSKEIAHIRNKNIGYIYQNYNLIHNLDVLQNVALPLGIAGINKKNREQMARKVIEEVGLASREKYTPSELSGGEQQRAAIARAIVTSPMLIIADEPTGNLDPKNANNIMEILLKLNAQGTGVIMVTHDMQAALYAQTRLLLQEGKLFYR